MTNILDYINWRGDLSLKADPINAIDSLIFSTLSYIELEMIYPGIKAEDTFNIGQAGADFMKQFADEKLSAGRIIPDQIFTLFDQMSQAERYRELILSDYVNRVDELIDQQFAALTIDLGSQGIYVAFRGTDDTIVGWKEDFNMSYQSPVPSQLLAVQYLETVAKKFKGRIYLGGHSKGGNLAVFAAVYSSKEIQKRIVFAHSFDGPGFPEFVIKDTKFIEMEDRLFFYVPQSSVIGMLLEHDENYQVVQSHAVGLFQHDPFSWQIYGKSFIFVDDITASTHRMDQTFRNLLLSMSKQEKEEFVDAFFTILTETGAKTLSDIKLKEITNILTRLYTDEVDKRKILHQTFRHLMKVSREQKANQVFKKMIPEISKSEL